MTSLRKRANRGEIPGKVVTVQDAVYETVHNTRGVEPQELADVSGIPYRQLLELADRCGQRKLRVEEIARLINATGTITGQRNYLILDIIERHVQRVAIDIPDISSSDTPGSAVAVATSSVRECADSQSAFCDAIDDEVVSDDEKTRFDREADQAIAAIERSRAYLALRCGKGAR